LIDDPRFATNDARMQNADEIDRLIQAFTRERTLEENLAYSMHCKLR
jgi:crotonobetainyl-CoA:carnitine CoA-transferase CaiB-like acyl-CoA transferase